MLHPDILTQVFKRLDVESLYRAALACKSFYSVIRKKFRANVIQYFLLEHCDYCNEIKDGAVAHLKNLISFNSSQPLLTSYLHNHDVQSISSLYNCPEVFSPKQTVLLGDTFLYVFSQYFLPNELKDTLILTTRAGSNLLAKIAFARNPHKVKLMFDDVDVEVSESLSTSPGNNSTFSHKSSCN